MSPSILKSRILTAMPAGLGGPSGSRTIRRIVWTLALASFLAWSLLAYGAHALLVGGAAFLQTQTEWLGAYAWLEPWLESGIGLTAGISVAITWVVWGVGAFLILLGAWLLPKAFGLFGGAPAR
jgi:hypothetical protein